ncbi:MAG: pyridoxamine 5'-phosphate oxidase [Gammaproteobacteria bacterium]
MKQLPTKLPKSPLPALVKWLIEAKEDGVLANPDAMALATANEDGQTSTRIVLCKEVVPDPGYLVFYTNYDSVKGQHISSNNLVSGAFHWDHLNRQVRFEGFAVRSPTEESDAYFATRDKESQIGAWASAQSSPLASRRALKDKHVATTRKLLSMAMKTDTSEIPRPPFWGGYRIWLSAVELWVRGAARLHDRGRWERMLKSNAEGTELKTGAWSATRIQP